METHGQEVPGFGAWRERQPDRARPYPARVFKEMTRLTKQKSKLEDLLTGINPFNAKSRAEEICKILDTYIPSVEKMDTLLRKYGVAFTKTASENKS